MELLENPVTQTPYVQKRIPSQRMYLWQSIAERPESMASDAFDQLFMTVNSDTASDFARLHEVLKHVVDVYFSQPYTNLLLGVVGRGKTSISRFNVSDLRTAKSMV